MKTHSLTILVMLLLCVSVKAQYAQIQNHYTFNKNFELELKSNRDLPFQTSTRPPGERMKSVGSSLTVGGAALFLIGTIVTATTDFDNLVDTNNTSNNSTTNTYSAAETQLILGIVMIEGGIGMMVPGIIFWTKGAKKLKRYQSEQGLSLGLKGAGVSLRLKL